MSCPSCAYMQEALQACDRLVGHRPLGENGDSIIRNYIKWRASRAMARAKDPCCGECLLRAQALAEIHKIADTMSAGDRARLVKIRIVARQALNGTYKVAEEGS